MFDKVHDEHMHECVTVVEYAKEEKMHREEEGGVFEHVCLRRSCSSVCMCEAI